MRRFARLLACSMLLLLSRISIADTAPNRDTELLIANILADPSIVAPVVEWRGQRADGTSYRYGISGWTLGGERTWTFARKPTVIASIDATPIHAHNSNRIFIAGERARLLEYSDASYRVRGGVRFATVHTTTDLQASVLYESVSEAAPCEPLPYADRLTQRAVSSMCVESASLSERWRRPYAGLDMSHTWSRIAGGNPLISSSDGFEVTGRAELMAGTSSFGRLSLAQIAGTTVGPWHVEESASALYGSRLDRVNRFLLGGSWDALGATAVYGFRYGEFRVRRAVSGNVGSDYSVGGTWRTGLRFSCLDSDVARVCGAAANVSTTWRTVGLNGGVGRPLYHPGAKAPLMIYFTAIVPLHQR